MTGSNAPASTGASTPGPASISDIMPFTRPSCSLGIMVVMAGALLLIPGFFTDALGLLLLIPPVRGLVIRLIGRKLAARGVVVTQTTVIEGDWQDVTPGAPDQRQVPPSDWTKH